MTYDPNMVADYVRIAAFRSAVAAVCVMSDYAKDHTDIVEHLVPEECEALRGADRTLSRIYDVLTDRLRTLGHEINPEGGEDDGE